MKDDLQWKPLAEFAQEKGDAYYKSRDELAQAKKHIRHLIQFVIPNPHWMAAQRDARAFLAKPDQSE
jgi:hypothetical protein